jgi:hypothetical protein
MMGTVLTEVWIIANYPLFQAALQIPLSGGDNATNRRELSEANCSTASHRRRYTRKRRGCDSSNLSQRWYQNFPKNNAPGFCFHRQG